MTKNVLVKSNDQTNQINFLLNILRDFSGNVTRFI